MFVTTKSPSCSNFPISPTHLWRFESPHSVRMGLFAVEVAVAVIHSSRQLQVEGLLFFTDDVTENSYHILLYYYIFYVLLYVFAQTLWQQSQRFHSAMNLNFPRHVQYTQPDAGVFHSQANQVVYTCNMSRFYKP